MNEWCIIIWWYHCMNYHEKNELKCIFLFYVKIEDLIKKSNGCTCSWSFLIRENNQLLYDKNAYD